MRVCGADVSGSRLTLVVVDVGPDGVQLLDMGTRKLELQDEKSQESVKSFFQALSGFVRLASPDLIAVKARAGKGQFAGGATTFKIEGLIQLIEGPPVSLISPVRIAAFDRKQPAAPPAGLFAYQGDAYKTALCAAADAG